MLLPCTASSPASGVTMTMMSDLYFSLSFLLIAVVSVHVTRYTHSVSKSKK